MKPTTYFKLIVLCLLILNIASCKEKQTDSHQNEPSQTKNEELFISTLKKHLNAITNKDLETLKSTMSPNRNMELIQPSSEIVYTAEGFMNFHIEWFKIPNWTAETKILSTNIGKNIGVATTELLYKEPERNGKPYFNRLIVSYTLEKIDGNWYFIKDHASSVEKTKPND